jgi:hypothetical protein
VPRMVRTVPLLIAVLIAGCSSGPGSTASAGPALEPSPTSAGATLSSAMTPAPAPLATATPLPTPDLAAVGRQYVALADSLSLTFCQVASIVGTEPTLKTWKAGLQVEIPALQQTSASLRALEAPADVQTLIAAVADAVDAHEMADQAMASAKTTDDLNLLIDTLLTDAISREGTAGSAARDALGLPPPSHVPCPS